MLFHFYNCICCLHDDGRAVGINVALASNEVLCTFVLNLFFVLLAVRVVYFVFFRCLECRYRV